MNNIKLRQENQPHIQKEDIEKYFYDIRNIFDIAYIQEKRELLKTFVYNISLNSVEHHIEITLCFQGCPIVEQVAGNFGFILIFFPYIVTILCHLIKSTLEFTKIYTEIA